MESSFSLWRWKWLSFFLSCIYSRRHNSGVWLSLLFLNPRTNWKVIIKFIPSGVVLGQAAMLGQSKEIPKSHTHTHTMLFYKRLFVIGVKLYVSYSCEKIYVRIHGYVQRGANMLASRLVYAQAWTCVYLVVCITFRGGPTSRTPGVTPTSTICVVATSNSSPNSTCTRRIDF